MKLNQSISKYNMATYLFLSYVDWIALGVIYGFVTFILEDPNYYNLTSEEVGKNMGYIGSVAEVAVIAI